MRPDNHHNSLFHMNEPLLFERHNIIECCRNGFKIHPVFMQNQEAKMLIKSLTETQKSHWNDKSTFCSRPYLGEVSASTQNESMKSMEKIQ